jgi:hypothetical protein
VSCAYGNRFPFFFGVVLLFLWGGLMTSGTRIHLHKRRRAYNVYIGLIFPRENIERNSQRHITHNNAQTHIHILWLNLFFSSVAPTRCTPPLFFFSLDAMLTGGRVVFGCWTAHLPIFYRWTRLMVFCGTTSTISSLHT